MHSTGEINKQEENTRLQNIYSLCKLQDYIHHTTVPGANRQPQQFLGVLWALLHQQLPKLQHFIMECEQHVLNWHPEDRSLYVEAHNFHLSQQQQHVVITSPMTTMQLPSSSSSSSSLEAAAIMVCVAPICFWLSFVTSFHFSFLLIVSKLLRESTAPHSLLPTNKLCKIT
jgi:hypothetical protein